VSGPTPGFLIWRLSTRWRVAVDRALAPLGLTHAQYSVLGSLLDLASTGQTPSQRALADHTGLEPLYMSKLARALADAGLIERTTDPTDSRAVRLSLTPAGAEVTSRAVTVVRRLADQLLAPLGGLDSQRTAAFVDELTLLLDIPLSVEEP
jgi:DNA-binding MarR family transcriptional regulator